MKIDEVPQDGRFFEKTDVRDLCYAVDENGEYKPVISVGWDAKNEALSLAWDEINEEAQEILNEVKAGKKSPLAYYMVKTVMSIKLLAAYTGISKKVIKKHQTADGFKTADDDTLQKYAEALQISINDLKSIV